MSGATTVVLILGGYGNFGARIARALEPFGLARAEDLKATLRRIIELHRRSAAEG
jgi:hypothetical protein